MSENLPTKVNLSCEGFPNVSFLIPNLDLQSIINGIETDQTLCWITRFTLATKDGLITTNTDLKSLLEKDTLNLIIKHVPYTEDTANLHAANTARIIFTFSSNASASDTQQTVLGWMTRHYRNNSKLNINDLNGIYPAKFANQQCRDLVKILDLSSEEPTHLERLQGVLSKYRLKTNENAEYTVTAIPEGFYVIPSKVYHTLKQLLCAVSNSFRDNHSTAARLWCELENSEHVSVNTPDPKSFAPSRKNVPLLKLFNIRPPTISNIDDLFDLAGEQMEESQAQLINEQYIRLIQNGISQVKRGLVPEINEGNYLLGDLFFSTPQYSLGMKGISNCYRTFPEIKAVVDAKLKETESKEKYRVNRLMLIDYFTERWYAQCVIPGLAMNKLKFVYGKATETDEFGRDAEFEGFLKSISDDLRLGPSKIEGVEEPIIGSLNTNGVIGSDGNKYIVTMDAITPRDANIPVPNDDAVIRPEAIQLFEAYKALEEHAEELEKLGGKKEFIYKGDSKELMERRAELLKDIPHIAWDVNAMRKGGSTEPSNIQKELSSFVLNILTKLFVQEYIPSNRYLVDGHVLVDELHSRGINVRYLGVVAKITGAVDHPHFMAFKRVMEAEMLARSIKTIARVKKFGVKELIDFINAVLSTKKTQQFEDAQVVLKGKYAYDLEAVPEGIKTLILLTISKAFGVTFSDRALKQGSDISLQDVISITPRVRMHPIESEEVKKCVHIGTALYMSGQNDEAEKYLTAAILSGGKSSITATFYLGLIALGKQQFDDASRWLRASIMLAERYEDELDPSRIVKYQLLGEAESQLGRRVLGLALSLHAASLARVLIPFHPFTVQMAEIAADAAQNVDFGTAARLFAAAAEDAAVIDKESAAQDLVKAASFAVRADQFKIAREYCEKALAMSDSEDIKQAVSSIVTAFNGK